ncbi:unnamed protein product [Porites lobata]|uniref:C3H1-type domain-containing protein n=1 Tax=Porites lobata TaxID=104759 RepID=A0ABN8RXE9_9CNID|nr:unnamed protein product [Porites lobata]
MLIRDMIFLADLEVSTEHIHWGNPDAPICPEFILGKCKNGSQCTGHHCILPYQWQYSDCNDHKWKNLNEEDNERLEKIKKLRRLSTESYVNSSNPLATKWIWYWQHESGSWRMYDKDDTVIKRGGYIFFGFWIITPHVTARNRAYFPANYQVKRRKILLSSKSQFVPTRKHTNLGRTPKRDDQSTLRAARPHVPQSPRNKVRWRTNPVQEGNTRGTDKPSHWSHMQSTTPYQRVQLSPTTDEFKEIEELFKNSFKWSVEILAIERVQNPYEWEKYQR